MVISLGREASPKSTTTDSARSRRARKTHRTLVACIACKQKKQRCDGQVPACRNCLRAKRECIIEDPTTKRRQPRAYVQSLEDRCAMLERLLQADHPGLALGHEDRNANVENISNGCSDNGNTADGIGSTDTDRQRHMFTTPADIIASVTTAEPECSCSNDLSSEVGVLCLNAAGREAPYFGPSSSFSFSRILSSGLSRLSSRSDLILGKANGYGLNMRAICPPEPPPSRSVGAMLSKTYFANINPQYPFLHQPTFAKWEDEFMTAHETGDLSRLDPSSRYFVFMVYAVAALIIPGDMESSAEGFYVSAQQYLDFVMQLDNMETIQAILCCAMYSIRSAYGASIWSLSGVAMRQCVKLGYHRSIRNKNIDPLKIELSKRCFWVSYDMDRAAGVTLGRPFCISDRDIDAEYPLDIDDASISVGGIFGRPRNSPNAPLTSVSYAIHLYKMRQMWSKLHETMYSTRSCQSIDFTFVDSMRRDLESWYAATPEQSYAAPEGQLSVFSSKEWFSIAYHHTILLIYRSHLIFSSHDTAAQYSGHRSARSQEAIDSAFTICSNAGRQICLLYRQLYISRSVRYTWGSLHMLFLGGLTYLHTLWASNDVRQATRREDVYTTCTACTMVLVIMAERWKAAAPYRDIFDTLSSKTITMMCDTERAPWPISQSNTRKQPGVVAQPATERPLGHLPFQDWIENVADIGMCEGVQSMLDTFLGERDIERAES